VAQERFDVREAYLRFLVEDVEANLARFDEKSGRFLTAGGWAVTNQDIVFPLALLYTAKHPANPYFGDDRILYYALRGADAWRDFQNPDGTVEFVKVDGSTWGPIYMPWSMYHWLETYALLLPWLEPARRRRWEEGLTLAYNGIARQLETAPVHNIPTWNGMACYRAGQIFGRADWQEVGRGMIERALAEQTPQGYWKEHEGPTTSYNFVYTHAIGLYHEFSGDERVLPCLERATEFHIRYTYPDGSPIETIDGRVKYHDSIPDQAHSAFSLFPQGRRFVRFLVERMVQRRRERREPHVEYIVTSGSMKVASAEYGLSPRLASAYLYYHSGPEEPILHDLPSYHVHDEGLAILRRSGRFFYCLSGFAAPTTQNRWGMDRQSFLSVWLEGVGLIIGGGNSKNQPEWSNFVLEAGRPEGYVPVAGRLLPGEGQDAVALLYAGAECRIVASVQGDKLLLQMLGPAGALAQLPLRLQPGQELACNGDTRATVGRENLEMCWERPVCLRHRGCRLELPAGASLRWPVYPFNPYAADGAAPLEQAVAVLSLPLKDGGVAVALSGA
jgi:hypothetical protein